MKALTIDAVARNAAKKISEIDVDGITGGNTQIQAIIQCIIFDAINESIDMYKEAYLNMKKYAEDNGLDTIAYAPQEKS